MDERRPKASTTSTALAEGALAPRDIPPPTRRPEPHGVRRRLPVRVLRRLGRMRKWKLVLLTGLTIFAVGSSVIYFGPASLSAAPPLQNATLLDIDGRPLAELRPEQNRVVVGIDEIPEVVQEAFVAVEDERFWSHWGVDPIAIARALFANAQGDREGASTITQQYVKNTFVGNERTIWRKIREAITAIRVDRKFSKEKILAAYLNSIYLGNGAYGVMAASRLYFGHDINQATLEEAALLAGITASPGRFDPRKNPDGAKVRRNYVLERMRILGMITPEEETFAAAMPIDIAPPVKQVAIAPSFVDWARKVLEGEFGEDVLYRGGLRVTTSLDLDVQRAAEEAIAELLDEPGDPEAAVVVIDVETGGVRAMVGGRGKRLGDLNLAVQGLRQAGSAFKPFVLAAGLKQGKTLDDRYSAPGSMRLRLDNGTVWKVGNYDRRGYGRPTLKRALAYSVNTVFAQLIRDVGASNVAKLAKATGVSASLRAVESLALGTSEVTAMDLATGYATFAREGTYLRTTALTEVKNREGDMLYRNRKAGDRSGRRAVTFDVASDVLDAMKEVVRIGTGRKARIPDYVTWGKTGTTEDFADAWFVGGAGSAVAAVWVGHPQGRVPMRGVHGINVVGSSFPLQIWKRTMETLLEKYKPDDREFRRPSESARPRVVATPTEEPSEEPSEVPSEDPSDPGGPLPLPTILRPTPPARPG
ncbi:MAG TPA: transglycosylase domain-containing protein [Actinomycetota bacterium]|nr:transglycosylase domain-containing protein [Actinomycetota bacterium]